MTALQFLQAREAATSGCLRSFTSQWKYCSYGSGKFGWQKVWWSVGKKFISVSSWRPMCSLYTGATVQDEERVLQRFLNDRTTSFHKNIRPVRNTLDPVNVTFDITFHSVIEMVCILCIWRCFSLSLRSACACVLPATPWNEILSVAFYKTIHYLMDSIPGVFSSLQLTSARIVSYLQCTIVYFRKSLVYLQVNGKLL